MDPSPRPALEVAALTRRLVAGEDMAYRTFHDAYFDRLSRYLLVAARGDETAMRDALQETFVRVARYIRVFTEEEVFWSWLTVLARSALFDATRKRSRYRALLDRFARQRDDGDREPDRIAHASERLDALLQTHLALLPTDERQLLEWKYSESRTVRAIAADAQTTEKAVESQLGRIRRKLKAAVLAQWRDESAS